MIKSVVTRSRSVLKLQRQHTAPQSVLWDAVKLRFSLFTLLVLTLKILKIDGVSAHASLLRFIKTRLLQLFPTPELRIFILLYILFFGRNEELE